MWAGILVAVVFGQPIGEDGKPVFRKEVSAWVDRWQADKAERIAKLKKSGAPRYRIERVRDELPDAPGVRFPLKAGAIGTFDDFRAVQFVEASVLEDAGFVGRVTITVPAGREQYLVGFRGFKVEGLERDALLAYDGFFVVRPFDDGEAAALVFEAIDLPAYVEEWARLHPDAEKPKVKAAAPPRVPKSDEEEAAGQLKAARALQLVNEAAAVRRLKAIAEKYPETKAGKDAARLLKK